LTLLKIKLAALKVLRQ